MRVKDREPCLAAGVEAARRDFWQFARGRFLAVLAVYIEKFSHRRLVWLVNVSSLTHSAQAHGQRVDNPREFLLANATDVGQASVVGGRLQICQ